MSPLRSCQMHKWLSIANNYNTLQVRLCPFEPCYYFQVKLSKTRTLFSSWQQKAFEEEIIVDILVTSVLCLNSTTIIQSNKISKTMPLPPRSVELKLHQTVLIYFFIAPIKSKSALQVPINTVTICPSIKKKILHTSIR